MIHIRVLLNNWPDDLAIWYEISFGYYVTEVEHGIDKKGMILIVVIFFVEFHMNLSENVNKILVFIVIYNYTYCWIS